MVENNSDISKFSQEDMKHQAALLLQKISNPEKGIGKELFDAIARLVVTLTPEAACLRKNLNTGGVEIYLLQRAGDDSAYPGQWHIPGSVMRPGEEIDDVFSRLEKSEIGIKITSKKFAFHFNNPKESRGHFFSLVYLCELSDGDGRGKWFPIDQLPENIVEHHKTNVISAAVKVLALN